MRGALGLLMSTEKKMLMFLMIMVTWSFMLLTKRKPWKQYHEDFSISNLIRVLYTLSAADHIAFSASFTARNRFMKLQRFLVLQTS